jgi:hypothetical protein
MSLLLLICPSPTRADFSFPSESAAIFRYMTTRNIVLGILVLVLVAAVSFVAGARLQVLRGRQRNINYLPRRMGAMMGGANGQTGQVSALTGNQITITFPNGSAQTVILTGTTVFSQLSPATQANLKTGENVTIFGQRSADGSVSAQSVRINQ